MRKKLILLILLVMPGLAAAGVSTYYCIWDYLALIQADQQVQDLARRGSSERELTIAMHRSDVHRINVAAEGNWMLLGAILAGIGIHGMVVDSRD